MDVTALQMMQFAVGARHDQPNSITIELIVQLNLEREIPGFGDGMTGLAPARIKHRLQRGLNQYEHQ